MTADLYRSPRTARFEFALLASAGIGAIVWPNAHRLFGVLLLGWVVMRFYRRMRERPLQPGDVRAFARHLSRLVYLLLYLMMLFSLGVRRLRPEDFQIYLAYGVVALIAIQALAALCRHLPAQLNRAAGTVSRKRTAEVT
jgi:cytochrome b561